MDIAFIDTYKTKMTEVKNIIDEIKTLISVK